MVEAFAKLGKDALALCALTMLFIKFNDYEKLPFWFAATVVIVFLLSMATAVISIAVCILG